MSEKTYTLSVIFEAKAGKENELGDLLTSLIAPTRKEPGCIAYRLHRSPHNPGQFLFYEIWKNKDAHAAHVAMPHMSQWHALKSELVHSVVKGDWHEVEIDHGK
jgi:quinol monooxygenase YgiN